MSATNSSEKANAYASQRMIYVNSCAHDLNKPSAH